MNRCVFCRIAADDLPSRTVATEETTLAFLDRNPLAPGHTLVIPRDHHERLQALPDELAADLYGTLQQVIPAVEEAVDADATTIGFNNGPAAGQEVSHVHGHVIPRFSGDGGGPIHVVAGRRPSLSTSEMDDLAAAIRTALPTD